jgi:hypothetical protein
LSSFREGFIIVAIDKINFTLFPRDGLKEFKGVRLERLERIERLGDRGR